MSTNTAELIRTARETVEYSRALLAWSRAAAQRSRELRAEAALARGTTPELVGRRSRAVAELVGTD